MTPETDDLTLGLGPIRWTDEQAQLERRFRGALSIPETRSRHPETDEPVYTPPYVTIPELLQPRPELVLSAYVEFDNRGGIEHIVLRGLPPDSSDDWGDSRWERWAVLLREVAVELGQRFGFGPIPEPGGEQSWNVRGVPVTLSVNHIALQLTVRRP
jgi:hypothetical protein